MKKILAKGTVFLMIAQFIFLTGGYIIHVGLGRMLGPSDYGVFGVILSLITIFEIFLMKGLPQSISKIIAGSVDKASVIFGRSIKLQLFSSISLTLIYLFLAGPIASFMHDNSLKPYIQLSALLIIPLTLLYLYINGFLNGIRNFRYQSILLGLNSICKVIFVFALVFMGLKVFGAILGYILAAIVSLIVAFFIFRPKKLRNHKLDISNKQILIYAFPLIISSLSFTAIRNIDLLILKNIVIENFKVGMYTASATLSRISSSLFVALSFTILPSVSKSMANKDMALTKKYIVQSFRYMILLLFPLTFIISATSRNIMILFYSSQFISGSTSLSILIFGSTFLTMFSLLNTIEIGTGNTKIAGVSALLLILLSVVLNYILIPIFGLEGAAIATTLTTMTGVVWLSIHIRIKFGVLAEMKSVIKIIISSLLVYLITFNCQFAGVYVLATCLISFIIYFIILVILKEINSDDVALVYSFLPFLHKVNLINMILKKLKLYPD